MYNCAILLPLGSYFFFVTVEATVLTVLNISRCRCDARSRTDYMTSLAFLF